MYYNVKQVIDDMGRLLTNPADPLEVPETILEFEVNTARTFDVKEAVAVSSGTAALHCALAALEIGPGDEVLVPAVSVVMSVAPVLYLGATPVVVDSEPGRIDFDYEDLQRKLSPMSKAVLPVYMWGCSYDLPRLMEFSRQHGLAVVEDACQAHGTMLAGRFLGTWGDLGCFSMKDGKLLATGEGGFVLTNEPVFAARCRAFRNHGLDGIGVGESLAMVAYNYRLTAFQAALGIRQLECFQQILDDRRCSSNFVRDRLSRLEQVEIYQALSNEDHNAFCPLFLLREESSSRAIARKLSEAGVVNSVGNFGLRPVQQRLSIRSNTAAHKRWATTQTPNAARLIDRALALRILPSYSTSDLERICQTVERIVVATNGK